MSSNFSIKALLSSLLIGAILGWTAHGFSPLGRAGLALDETKLSGTEELPQDLDLTAFWEVWSLLKTRHVDFEEAQAQGTQAQVFGAIQGLVNSFGDPYSVFMTPEETTSFDQSLAGELQGIGAELTEEEGAFVVVSPLKNSPAEKAGLLPGDHIVMVDDTVILDLSLWEVIMKIRGPEGTDVKLTLLREGEKEPIEKIITREELVIPSVNVQSMEVNGKSVVVIALYQFGDDTTTEFLKAVQEVQLASPDALVLDLRMNGGGYLNSAVEILSEFFADQKTAVRVKYRDAETEVLKTSGHGRLSEIPLAVVIDNGSASASEILAGALQDYGRAILVGTQSFGKGSVQELDDFSDGSSLRLTVAKWYTPLDRSIHHTGITPDILIEREAGIPDDPAQDVQLQAAIQEVLK
jgi:carboxyl-terminal processing protease